MIHKIKIVMKFRGVNEVIYSIPADEAHKAYYLFVNPHKRTIFNNGLAIKGEDIERIEPDVIGTMGWNQGYKLSPEDNLETQGIKRKLEKICWIASQVGKSDNPQLDDPLSKVIKENEIYAKELEYVNQFLSKDSEIKTKNIEGGFKQIGEL